MPPTNIQDILNTGSFLDFKFLNLEYWFYKILELGRAIASVELPFGIDLLSFLKVLFTLIAIFLMALAIYFIIRIEELKATPNIFLTKIPIEGQLEKTKNDRWDKILQYINSHNASDWRLAILEADNMLDDLTKKLGYQGENLGERLKSVDASVFSTIDYAWEAHRVRNKIAHEGTDYILNHYEAKRVIVLFERVFKDFNFI